MVRVVLLTFLVASTALLAAPAPFLIKKQAPIESLVGTVWHGDGVVSTTTYRFLPDGKMTYSYNRGTYTTGKWHQEGSKIFWDMNNRYCWFEGEFKGELMYGVARNKPGGRWDLKMKLVSRDQMSPR